jgi:hypothetical protein
MKIHANASPTIHNHMRRYDWLGLSRLLKYAAMANGWERDNLSSKEIRIIGHPRSILLACVLAGSVLTRPATADTLAFSPAFHTNLLTATYRLAQPVTGQFTLLVAWTDAAGRLVMQQAIPQILNQADVIQVPLDLGRAAVMVNQLQARLFRADGTIVGAATAPFIARPRDDGWDDYPIIIWQDQTPARSAGLKRIGIDGGRVFGNRGPLTPAEVQQRVAPLVTANLRIYIENIATDFYAAYHRFRPGHPVTWAFDQVRTLAAHDPANPAIFQRQPSLSDANRLDAVRTRLMQHVQLFGPYRPLYYSLGDETGIADLAAAWDFDLGPASLNAMRAWLRTRYATLAALNAQWGSHFIDWGEVMPMTTSEAISTSSDNFSAWTDFKEAMDAAFASAVRDGTEAVHTADTEALAALEGAQIPGWGGYDYTKLAHAVDAMELYDLGNNVEIVRSLNPDLKVLTTTGVDNPNEVARLWHELLLGSRGLIVWDENAVLVDDSGRPSTLGLSMGAQFTAFRSGLAAQLAASVPAYDRVAILYSPASFRVSWLLDRRADGQDWMKRNSEIEGQDSPLRASMRQAAEGLVHLGLTPRWVAEDGLANLLGSGTRALLLPQVIALSPAAVTNIKNFVDAGGLVLADVPPGEFDSHGRRRATMPFGDEVTLTPGWPIDNATTRRLQAAGVTAQMTLDTAHGTRVSDIDARVLHNGAVTLIGLQRDSAKPDGGPENVVLILTQPGHVYDLRRHASLGWTNRVTLAVTAAEPALLAISPVMLPSLTVHGPSHAVAGADVTLQIDLQSPSPASADVVHVEARDPSGGVIRAYSGNLTLHNAPTAWHLPLALNDPAGQWVIRVTDQLGGSTADWTLNVEAATRPAACAMLACAELPY